MIKLEQRLGLRFSVCMFVKKKAAEMKLHDLFNLSKVKVLSEAREIQSGGVFSIFRFQACLEICGTA